MANQVPVHKSCGFEDSGLVILARIYESDGSLILQADYGTIACQVYDKDDSADTGTAVTVTVANAVFDTLQTDSVRWDDTTGYNFEQTIPATVLSSGGTTYEIEFTFTPTAGEPFKFVVEHSTRETRVS